MPSTVIANVPIGQAAQAVTYVPGAVPQGDGTQGLQPLGVAVVIEASHLCMMMRGVQKQNSVTTTSAFWGEFEKNETRSEFTKLISSNLH